MLAALFGLLVIVGQVVLAVGAFRSLRTGNLEPYSSWTASVGRPPMSRAEAPSKFWTLWAAQVWVSMLPLAGLAAVLAYAFLWSANGS
jgi:hypothetical protein